MGHSPRCRTFSKAKSIIKSLTEQGLDSRLRVLRSAWILGGGDVSQPWLQMFGNRGKKVLISQLHDAFAAFEADPSISLPIGMQGACWNKEWSNWKATVWREWKANREKKTPGKAAIFKYGNEMYQSVKNFCDNYKGLKNSKARVNVEKTDFPLWTYLVIPGQSSYNYRHIPEDWKNGTQDLSDLEGAAYILGQRKRPTGSHLLLVSHTELNKAAESALLSSMQT